MFIEPCQVPLCYTNQKDKRHEKVIFFSLSVPNQLELDTEYMWVIKESNPGEILVAKLH